LTETSGRELYVRHAKRDGRSVAVLRAIDHGGHCVVETDVFSSADEVALRRPYRFADAREATAFVTDAVETLMYLGCEIFAQ
jgi:hypothetical protein